MEDETQETDAPEYDVFLGRPLSATALRRQEQKDLTFVRRGMGKTGITHRVMTDAERMTICMLRGKGLSYDEIAEKIRRTPSSVRGVIFQAQKAAAAAGLNYDWREDLREKSVAALRAGLTHDKEPYKAAGLAVQTLKGLGEFESEGQVHIAQLLNSIPENQRERYVSLDTSDAIEIEGGEVPEKHVIEPPAGIDGCPIHDESPTEKTTEKEISP